MVNSKVARLAMVPAATHAFVPPKTPSVLRGARGANSVSMAAEPLEYASSCFLPTSWTSLPLISRKEYNYDSTLYDFGLPEGKSLNLPACGCILLLAPGAERDGSDQG